MQKRFSTYSAEGGRVALVICCHSFHRVLLSHLEQKKQGKLKALAADGTLPQIYPTFLILVIDRVEHFLYTKQKFGRIEICIHIAEAIPFIGLSLVPPPKTT
jgi:hypothetical protein